MTGTEKTPLQKIQDETADYLDPWNMPAITRAALDAFLVQAFDAGVAAARELDAEAYRCPSCGSSNATEDALKAHTEAAH